ncbi:MAG: glycosyltransferase family 39 protein [Lentisphaeria bacterium]|nr:glycosyltransferase family 39 protein [Lentisphaeria bacterium]
MTLPRFAVSPRTRKFLVVLGAVAAVGLLLRLLVCWELRGTVAVVNPVAATDMATYRRIALEIVNGQWPEHFYYQPLYYAVFLPLVYLLTAQSVWGVLLVQSLLGATAVWLTGLAAARLFGRRAGIVAAACLALARFSIFYTPFLLMATLQAFWMALLLYLAVVVWQRPRWWRWLLIGLVASLAILTRGNVLLLVPGLLALLAWRHRRQPVLVAGLAVGLLAMVYLPQLPFALRNYHHYGRWTGPSSAMDAVLALGNTVEAPAGGLEYPPAYQEAMRLASLPGDERVSAFRQMVDWARREPLVYGELKGRTFLLFWNRQEIPNNVIFSHHGAASWLLKMPFLLDFAVLGALGVFGMLLSWRWRSPRRLYLYYAVLMYCAGTVIFYVLARFRIPMIPWVCVFAGNGVMLGYRRFRYASGEAGRRRRLLLGLAAVFAVFFVNASYQLYQFQYEAAMIRWLRPQGTRLELPDRVIHHDHGPLGGTGGSSLQGIPPDGSVIVKRFVGVELPPGGQAILRVPVVRIDQTRVDYQLPGLPFRKEPFWEKDMLGFEWLNLPVTLPAAEDGVVQIAVALRAKDGDAAVVFDQFRDYGRTTVPAATPGTRIPEAAFELVLPKN